MSSAQESMKIVGENVPVNEANLVFNEVLFGIAMLAFVALVVMEKLQPYRRFNNDMEKNRFLPIQRQSYLIIPKSCKP